MKRYTLHFISMINGSADSWQHPDYIPSREKIDFDTLHEAREYLSIVGDAAYIIDNVTNERCDGT